MNSVIQIVEIREKNIEFIRYNMTLRSKDVNAIENSPNDQNHSRSDHNLQFYQEYKKIFSTGYYLSQQLKQLIHNKEDLWKQLLAYEKRAEEEFRDKIRKQAPQRKKRFRRTADEIEKRYTCQAQKCQRSYGTEGSLLQHLKLKHPEIYDQLSKGDPSRNSSFSGNIDSNQ